MPTVRFSVRLPESIYKEIAQRADASGLSMSESLVYMLRDYLNTEPLIKSLVQKIDLLVAEKKR